MILVTNKDGSTTALNVERIERIELNDISQGRESNVFLVGGGRLVVVETPEVVLERIEEAKARVIARSFALSANDHTVPIDSPGQQTLRVLPPDWSQ